MTHKKRAELWNAQWMLTNRRPVWWKRAYMAVVFWISPPMDLP